MCPDPQAGNVSNLRSIDRERGCVVLVRPDQYVVPLDSHDELAESFASFLIDPAG